MASNNTKWLVSKSLLCNEPPRNYSDSMPTGLLSSECMIDVVSCIPSILFSIVSLALLIVLSFWKKCWKNECMHTKFPWHSARWLFFLGLYVTNIAEIGEGVLSDQMYSGKQLHLYFTPVIYLLSNFMANVYYQQIEARNMPKYLIVLLVYWISVLTMKFIKWIYTIHVGLNVLYMRFDLTFDNIAGYCAMIVAEIVVIIKLVR